MKFIDKERQDFFKTLMVIDVEEYWSGIKFLFKMIFLMFVRKKTFEYERSW